MQQQHTSVNLRIKDKIKGEQQEEYRGKKKKDKVEKEIERGEEEKKQEGERKIRRKLIINWKTACVLLGFLKLLRRSRINVAEEEVK